MRAWVRWVLLGVSVVALACVVAAVAEIAWAVSLDGGRASPLVLVLGLVGFLVGGLGFWALIGLGAWRRSREGPMPASVPRRAAPPPPEVPSGEALADLREPVTACPSCGFLGIRPAGIGEGAWPGGGELVKITCPRCDYLGMPLEFPRREDYAAWLAEMRGSGA